MKSGNQRISYNAYWQLIRQFPKPQAALPIPAGQGRHSNSRCGRRHHKQRAFNKIRQTEANDEGILKEEPLPAVSEALQEQSK